MSRFIESIRIFEGKPKLLRLHQERMDRSCLDISNTKNMLQLQSIFTPGFLADYTQGVFKCRIEYDANSFELSCAPYTTKLPASFQLVSINFDYPFKFIDRSRIEAARQKAMEEVIMVKEDRITDGSIYNLLFFDGSNWFTPKQPLLAGVMRAALLEKQMIKEREIRVNDLIQYSHILPINSMNPFSPSSSLPIDSIVNLTNTL